MDGVNWLHPEQAVRTGTNRDCLCMDVTGGPEREQEMEWFGREIPGRRSPPVVLSAEMCPCLVIGASNARAALVVQITGGSQDGRDSMAISYLKVVLLE